MQAMTRVPPRRAGAIQTDSNGAKGEVDPGAEPTPEAPHRVGIAWRVVILVWLCGFGGLFLYELGGFVWKLGKRVIAGP
jgi:hypothetical protein